MAASLAAVLLRGVSMPRLAAARVCLTTVRGWSSSAVSLAGHSKWANTKHRKAAQDAKRMKVFTKLTRAITAAAKSGGADMASNLVLASCVDKARAANVPRDVVEAAIKRATDPSVGASETVVYEGVGPGGSSVIVEVLTDNRKRTAPMIRSHFARHGGELQGVGSVAFNFESRGVVELAATQAEHEDAVLGLAMDAGADDLEWFEAEDGAPAFVRILCDPPTLREVRKAFEGSSFPILSSAVERRPTSTVELSPEAGEVFGRLLEALEDEDDVQNVFHNAA